jgi:hypothetical protein
MSLVELLPTVQALPRADKLRLVQLLIVDIAREEGVPMAEPGIPFPVWSPYNAFDAAIALQKALENEGATP